VYLTVAIRKDMSSSAQLNKPSETTISSDEAKPIEVSSRTVTLSATTTATVPLTAHAPVAISNPNTNNNGTGHKSQPSSPPAPASGDKKEKKQRAALYSENVPTFYCGSGNNSELYINFSFILNVSITK